MLNVPLPQPLSIEHVVLDFNGTLACDGALLDGVAERLMRLAPHVMIHVVTGNTFGNAPQALAGLPCKASMLGAESQAEVKRDYVTRLGPTSVACIGNGRNDALMMQVAALSIAVLQREGAASVALAASHVVCRDINDALDLLVNPMRLVATLRP